MPFAFSDGTCAFCHEGLHTACVHVGFFGNNGMNGAQAEALRVPFADGTLFPLPVGEDDALMPSLLTLSDVMGTGHHAAVVRARSRRARRAAVVGDGAVGLCGVIAAKRLGAEQIIILGRHADRIALAQRVRRHRRRLASAARRRSSASASSPAATAPTRCSSASATARRWRPRSASRVRAAHIGRVGVPQEETLPASQPAFFGNVHIGGGPAPVRAYIEELLPDILEGRIEPGRVFDRTVGLDERARRLPRDGRPRVDQGHGPAVNR